MKFSIAESDEEKEVHEIFLKNNIPILQNLDLNNISNGVYTLAAFPLLLEGMEASPVRAVLFQ